MLSSVTGKWSIINPMKVARDEVRAVAMDNRLYVVGGCDGSLEGDWDGVLRSGEVYDPATQEWTELPDMNLPRCAHSLVVLQGKLVVIGGYTGRDTTNKVEQLDLLSNTWEEMEELPCTRSALSSGVISFNKLKEEARDTFRLERPDVMSNGTEILVDEADVIIGNSSEEMDTSNAMSFNESDEEMME